METAPKNNLLLTTEKLVKEYRGRRVVNGRLGQRGRGVKLSACSAPNGAGKTTTFNMVVGVVKPDEGAVFFSEPQDHHHADAQARAGWASVT